MKDFIEYLVKQIVPNADLVKIEEVTENTVTTIKICVADEDMGILIGKSGKTIRSLRALAKSKAIKEGIKVYLEVCEKTAADAADAD